MLEELALACESPGCERSLGGRSHRLSITTAAGTRHAYECDCGAVTITVARE
ncbi:MAG: hypothetical protein ACQETB_01850 [Halobacteriota archaeon]